MITFEGVQEGTHWKLMRNKRLICYCNKRVDAERMLIGFHDVTVRAGKPASLQVFDPAVRRLPAYKPRALLTAKNKIGT